MKSFGAGLLVISGLYAGSAWAGPDAGLAAHRAAYELSLADAGSSGPPGAQTPVAATGLIAYEFRGSACEGYASNFRQITELQRNEGEPINSDLSSVTFEDGDGKALQFEIDGRNSASIDPPISGSAARADGDKTTVQLYKPDKAKVDLGAGVLFPTQHIETILATAKAGGSVLQARVYDGSETGRKVFLALAVLGREATAPSPDAKIAPDLAGVRRWPVTVSYFNEAIKDSSPDYTLAYDLYENGVSGTLKLDYGRFMLEAKLSKLEFLKTAPCGK